mmetsp:Transcript_16223/g.50955  ORF Transcript_16223/g.50955 Transcript_16223/m.50955 type:complete len:242 (-) Transcript_16223:479-1204(-)
MPNNPLRGCNCLTDIAGSWRPACTTLVPPSSSIGKRHHASAPPFACLLRQQGPWSACLLLHSTLGAAAEERGEEAAGLLGWPLLGWRGRLGVHGLRANHVLHASTCHNAAHEATFRLCRAAGLAVRLRTGLAATMAGTLVLRPGLSLRGASTTALGALLALAPSLAVLLDSTALHHLPSLAHGLRPVKHAVVDKDLAHEEVLEEAPEVRVVGSVLETQGSAVVEVRGKDCWIAFAECLNRR